MEAATVATDRRNGRRKPSSPQVSQYDQELTKAKREKRPVDLVLAADFATPHDGLLSADDTIAAEVLWVDRFAVKFRIMKNDTEVWVNKAFIAGVWMR